MKFISEILMAMGGVIFLLVLPAVAVLPYSNEYTISLYNTLGYIEIGAIALFFIALSIRLSISRQH